jgi:hypothetical protein
MAYHVPNLNHRVNASVWEYRLVVAGDANKAFDVKTQIAERSYFCPLLRRAAQIQCLTSEERSSW